MEARAVAKFIRMSPRKIRKVVDLIRGKKVGEALSLLKFTPARGTESVEKALKSAIANAEHNLELNVEELVVSKVHVDEGPTIKRIKPRAMGRADQIRKRTSHITVVVSEKKEG